MIRTILGFHRFRCPVAHGLVQPFRVPPRDPPERRQLQVLQIMEGLAPPDELGLVRAVGGFGHGVVVGVADRAGRRQHAVFHHPGGVHRAGVLHAMIAVVDETVGPAMRRGSGDRLLQRLQGQLLRVHGGGARPAHDPPGEHVGDECGIRVFLQVGVHSMGTIFQQHRRLVSSRNRTVGTRRPFFLGYLVMRARSLRYEPPSNLTSLPWRTVRSINAAAMFLSPSTRPQPENSMFVV